MKGVHLQLILTAIVCALATTAASADTLIYNNSGWEGGYFWPTNSDYNEEFLDYGTSSGGLVSKFEIGYATELSNPGTLYIRFWQGTARWQMGNVIKTIAISDLEGSPNGNPYAFYREYILPEEERFNLPSGNFGYSYEFSWSYDESGPLLASGGLSNQNYYWLYYINEWYDSQQIVDGYAGFYMKVYTGPALADITCDITGTKFDDTDGDGIRDAGEPGLPGWEIYVDINNNDQFDPGVDPNVVTDPNGVYFFENLDSPATYTIREVAQDGWTQTLPGGPNYEYTIVTEPNNLYGPYDFGNTDQVITKYGGGDGTAGNPYQIWTATHMNQIGTHQEDWASHFILMDDINMSGITGEQYNIIGYHNSTEDYLHFTGTFNGNNHVIQNFTYVTSADQGFVGLFGYIENAQIIDLTLTNVTVSTAGGAVGGLAGYQKYGTISNCHTDASVMGQSFMGGLVGFSNAGMISQCSSTGSVTNGYQGGVCGGLVGLLYKATVTDSFSNAAVYGGLESHEIGGLLGIVQGVDAVVERCYSSGDVTAGENSIAVGGLVGYLFSGDLMKSFSTGNVVSPASEAIGGLVGTISMGTAGHCYSLGNVTASGESIYVGGFVGVSYDDIACCFSTGTVTTTSAGVYVGGFAGLGYGVFNSFWDIRTSGLTYSNGGKGRTTLQMQEASNYINWNTAAQTNWVIDEGNDYPHLIWEGTPGIAIPTHNITGYLDGLGTPAEPYLVQNASDLNTIGLFDNEWDKDYRLTADIDMSGITGNAYNMIGTLAMPFSGTFDGDGYWVDHFTYTSESIEGDAGLFKVISGTVRNLSMEDTLISINGGTRIGILAGTVTEEGVLDNCYTQGSIETSAASDTIGGLVGALSGALNSCESTIEVTVGNESDYIGGLIGYAYSDSILTQCGSVASITTGDDCQFVGGLAGRLNCSVTQSYADGTITTGNYTENLGGLVGYFGSNIDMTNCYSKTEVIGGSYSEKLGGLIGWSAGDMEYCYSMGLVSAGEPNSNLGGLVGYGSVAYQCYWDKQTSGQSTSATGTGRDTEQMLTQSTYSGWDFNNTWRICDGMNYPRLQWEPKPVGDFVCPEGVEVSDLMILMDEWLADGPVTPVDMAPEGGDGIVNLSDWQRFAVAWKTTQGQPGYDSGCDLAPEPADGSIDELDLCVFADQWLSRSARYADIAPVGTPDGKVDLSDYCVFAENWLLGID